MRIRLEGLGPLLTELLGGRQVLLGQVQRLTAASVLLRFGQEEVELALEELSPELQAALGEGVAVELHRSQGAWALRVKPGAPLPAPRGQEVSLQTLAEALVALDLRPTEEVQLVAKGLLERGFPLHREYLLALLPWAERGQLEEALWLWEAGFPLTPALVELVADLRREPPDQPILEQAAEKLPPKLQEALRLPGRQGRTALGLELAEGRLGKDLARLLSAERLFHALAAAPGGENFAFVFFLPCLRGADLFAAWAKITDEGKTAPGESRIFRLELLLPTEAFGMVRAELAVWGKEVRLNLASERNCRGLAAQMGELEAELGAAGWRLQEVKVGELEPCAKPLLYAMIGK